MTRLAFYDLDGTLVSSNVVDQYLWYARQASDKWWRLARAAMHAPGWLWAEKKSRLLFNDKFFREYRGLSEAELRSGAERMAREVLTPALFAKAEEKLAADRAQGFVLVLVTGSLDFAVGRFANELGFEEVLANRMEFRNGIAEGRLISPVMAEQAKVDAVLAVCARHGADPAQCRAYSDSTSDAPMLETVGESFAVNPSKGLRRIAESKRWPILMLQ